MIVYDLSCQRGHRFEGWFGSSTDFAEQRDSGLLSCPSCGSQEIAKAPMAPSVSRKGNQGVVAKQIETPTATGEAGPVSNSTMPKEVVDALSKLAEAQKKALKDSKWVGRQFAEQSRAMHYGEADHSPIHGEASVKEAKDLVDEGVSVSPLPFPVAPPDELN